MTPNRHPALTDIGQTLSQLPAIAYISWSDTKARYKRSVLGPFWLTIGTGIGVGGLGYVWGTLLHKSLAEFIPTLSIGLILWGFIAGIIVESTQVFISNAPLIRNLALPHFFHPVKLVSRHLINLAHNLVVLLVIFLIYPPHWNSHALLAIPGFILVVLNLTWMSVLIGMLAARYRDFETAITNFMPILFFLSPVLFKADQLGAAHWILWLNPFSYLISIVRDPLIGQTLPAFVWPVSLLITLIGGLLTFWLFQSRHTRIPYWI